ncbi:MAG TPA: BON domain-containing protein [Thermoleophilaceae bacterium]|jgi:osmotically-inducible protein OsmY
MKVFTLLTGAAVGAAAVWFLDPDNGKQRQAVARDKAMKYARSGKDQAVQKADYAAGVAKGAAASAAPGTSRPDAGERLNDPALARKVESEIFRSEDAPKGQVSVNVQDGVVFLRGEVDDEGTIEQLATGAEQVEGVRKVENLLHTPGAEAPTT